MEEGKFTRRVVTCTESSFGQDEGPIFNHLFLLELWFCEMGEDRRSFLMSGEVVMKEGKRRMLRTQVLS